MDPVLSAFSSLGPAEFKDKRSGEEVASPLGFASNHLQALDLCGRKSAGGQDSGRDLLILRPLSQCLLASGRLGALFNQLLSTGVVMLFVIGVDIVRLET